MVEQVMDFKKYVETEVQPGLAVHSAAIALVYARGVEDLDLLSYEARVIYLAWSLHGEIMNGGFSQYFSNSSGKNAVETLAALQTLNAFEAYNLLLGALVVFPESSPSRDDEERWAQYERWLLSTDGRKDLFEQLSDAYYELDESMDRVTDAFVRLNPDATIVSSNS